MRCGFTKTRQQSWRVFLLAFFILHPALCRGVALPLEQLTRQQARSVLQCALCFATRIALCSIANR
jgi:hypothetical protein